MNRNKNFAALILTVILSMGFVIIGCQDLTKPDTGPSLPAAPTDLTLDEMTETSISVFWTNVSNATKYHVYAGTTTESLALMGSITATSYLIEGLSPNTTYYIAVSAENKAGEGEKSAEISVTTNQISPQPPTGLASLIHTETSITIMWDTVSDATKYHVYAGTTAESLALMGSITATSYLIEGLSPNTTYYIAVSAENGAGEGDKTAAISVKTNQIPPQQPTGLISLTHTETSITIVWDAVSGAAKYHVYAGTTAGSLTLRGSPTSLYYVIDGLIGDRTYYIEVSAENEAGEGEKSAAITVTTNQGIKPAAPSGLTAEAVTETSIAISWNNVSGAVSYNVFTGTTPANMTNRGNPTATNFTVTGLTANTTYYIAVSARTASNESDQCTPINTVTKPTAPTGLTTGTVTSNSIAVTWTGITGVSGYTVYAGISSGNMTQQGTPTAASYTITGLTANTAYYIAVSARNASGEGSQSSPITATTKLPAPAGLIATPQSASSSIQVSWNAVSGAASYNVFRSASETGTYSSIGTTSGTSYNDTGRTVSTPYYYKVSAVTSGNTEGELSDSVSATIPAQTKSITQFRFADFSVNGTINGTNISVTVPNIVNLTTLVPTIVHNGKSVSPASGVAQNFSSQIQYTVTAEDNTTQNYNVTVSVTNTSLPTAFTWINNNYSSGKTYTIVAQSTASIAPVTINTSSTVNISISGGTSERTISLNANGSLFTISAGTLTLGNNITLEGRSSNNASLVKLSSSNASLVMNTGSKIINNTVTVSTNAAGGAVNVGSGTFTMNGGTISGNKVDADSSNYDGGTNGTNIQAIGGGVYVSTGTFIMNNGTITDNTAFSDNFPAAGGGVHINNGTFTLVNGTISNNTADSRANLSNPYAYGGGVSVWNSSEFIMQGGTISGNIACSSSFVTAYYYGGGVYVRNNKFRKTGGTIYGSNGTTAQRNHAQNRDSPNTIDSTSGHAVYVLVGSTIMRRNNTAGTGVSLDSSKTGSAGGWE